MSGKKSAKYFDPTDMSLKYLKDIKVAKPLK
jgi:hypothetical protein